MGGLATLYYKSKMDRRHVGFSINANNFDANGHTSTKLGGIKKATCQSDVCGQIVNRKQNSNTAVVCFRKPEVVITLSRGLRYIKLVP